MSLPPGRRVAATGGALLVATGGALALMRWLPLAPVDRLLWGALSLVPLYVAASLWLCHARRPTPVWATVGIGLVGGVIAVGWR